MRLRSRTNARSALGALLASLCAVAVLGPLAGPASAETRTVANLKDSGAGSLRQTIAEAAVNDTVVVPAGQVTLTSGPLTFNKNLMIAGAGSGATTLSGNDASRVFTITGTPTVTLKGLTITHGKDPNGAGINAVGTLALEDVVVSGNHAGGAGVAGFGGGIDFGAGILSLLNSSISANTAGGGAGGSGFGGGIEYTASEAAHFTLTLNRSSVSGNTAGVGDAGFGAGIDTDTGFDNGAISITLTESSVSGNAAGGNGNEGGFGGGISLGSGGDKNVLTLALDRAAVTGNSAGGGSGKSSGFGGGIDFSSGGKEVTQTLTVANSTISSNMAGGPGAAGFAGGMSFGAGTATLSHVTVAGNSAGAGGGAGGLEMGAGSIGNSIVAANSGGNCSAPISSGGHNIDDGKSCGFTGTADKSGVDARLGPVGDHGGLSLTQMPLAGSPAIDSADAATCPPSDQRGVSRPQGGGCDIGAVEVPPPLVTTGSVSSASFNSAVVGGSVNPNFSATSYHVDFGTTTAYGNFTAVGSAGEGGISQAVSSALAGLKPQTLYHFRLVATNAAGTVVGADQTLSTSRAPLRPITVPRPLKALSLSAARLTNKRFRVGKKATAVSARRAPVGTTFRFRVSAAAKVRIIFTRTARGLRLGRTCVAPSAKLRHAHAKKCTRTLVVGTLTRSHMRAGANSIAFSGRIGSRPLGPRGYRAILTASATGKRPASAVLSFTVVR